MRKILLILILFSLILPIVASGVIEIQPPIEARTFAELIGHLINIIFTIALVLAPVMIIIGAFYFLIPSEGGKNIETGKNIIKYTIIGFIIIIAATGIVELLERVFRVEEQTLLDFFIKNV